MLEVWIAVGMWRGRQWLDAAFILNSSRTAVVQRKWIARNDSWRAGMMKLHLNEMFEHKDYDSSARKFSVSINISR